MTPQACHSLADLFGEVLLRTAFDMRRLYNNKAQARDDDYLLGRNSTSGTGIIEGVSGKTYKITVTVL
jgi:hypothetical protein